MTDTTLNQIPQIALLIAAPATLAALETAKRLFGVDKWLESRSNAERRKNLLEMSTSADSVIKRLAISKLNRFDFQRMTSLRSPEIYHHPLLDIEKEFINKDYFFNWQDMRLVEHRYQLDGLGKLRIKPLKNLSRFAMSFWKITCTTFAFVFGLLYFYLSLLLNDDSSNYGFIALMIIFMLGTMFLLDRVLEAEKIIRLEKQINSL
jgi:hypothetical protein